MVTKPLGSAELARVISVRGKQLAWLFGAGASAAAGIPTASAMTLDFKTRLFCAATNIPRPEVDAGDPLWRERIAAHFKANGALPPAGDPAEYSRAFEAAFPSPSDRRGYLDECISKGTPSFGNRVIGALIAASQAPCLFTTNFDQLIERSSTVAGELLSPETRASLTVAALDSVERAERCLRENDWPLLVKLHGDYQSESLKNTSPELEAQDERMRNLLGECVRRFGLVVVGYSGRDASVMQVLHEAISDLTSFPAGIFWVHRPQEAMLPAVQEFLDRAKDGKRDVHLVEAGTFDEFAGDLVDNCGLPETLRSAVKDARPRAVVTPVELPQREGALFPVLRCSALPLMAMPAEARKIVLAQPSTTPELRALLRGAGAWGTVRCDGTVVSAFGSDADLLRAFAPLGAKAAGTVRVDVADSGFLGLIYDAFMRAACQRRPLKAHHKRNGHFLVVRPPNPGATGDQAEKREKELQLLKSAYGSELWGTVPNLGCGFVEALRIRLEHVAASWWCVFEPFTFIDLQRGEGDRDAEGDNLEQRFAAADWRRERWATRRNQTWAQIIDAWAKLLAPQQQTELRAYWLPDGVGHDAAFRLGSVTGWSRPARGDKA